jgi:hypothetical protein
MAFDVGFGFPRNEPGFVVVDAAEGAAAARCVELISEGGGNTSR